jgi:DNA-binding PadR family transcriptional regulator
VSPIFRHGRLRLYLLKLLDEAPRHGYEVIRLLQDRFMGVYSPSPGTIYPRLARLEEDGLVTHDEVDGRKVYRITEKGREEIRGRLDDLAELEDELTQSVRDIAREVTEDVRDTVRSLREEITWAARDVRRDRAGRDRAGQDSAGRDETGPDSGEQPAADEAARIRDEARRTRDDIRGTFRSQRRSGAGRGPREPGSRDAGRPDWGRQDWGGQDWGSWADRAAGWQAWGDRREQAEQKDPGGRSGWSGWQDWAARSAGLDRLASEFARELSSAAGHAGDIGDHALGELRDILSDTLARIRDEIFTGPPQAARDPAGQPAEPQPAENGTAEHGTAEHGPAGEAESPAGTDRGPTA